MSKKIKWGAIALATTLGATMFAGCGVSKDNEEKIDTNKSQLRIFCIDSGFKTDWLWDLKYAYEEATADKEFEEGKTGVQVILDPQDAYMSDQDIKADDTHDIFIVEHVMYGDWVNKGIMANISSAIKNPSPYDTKTIEERMSSQQKQGLDWNGEYYAIPFFYGNYGLIYNADLFDTNEWYFDADGNIGETSTSSNLGTGPNGVSGDYDDGLPATYDQFFALCDEIYNYDVTPVMWTGTSYKMHFEGLLNCLIADYEGYDDMVNRLNFTGTQEVVKLDNSGNILFDENEKIQTESIAVAESNGYDAYRTPGMYYALQFIQKLIDTDKYHNPEYEAFGNFSQLAAQESYIRAGYDTRETAMLLDGDWWMQEATEVFDKTEKTYGGKADRNFKWMPLPKATEDMVYAGNRSCDYDDTNGYVFVSANTDEATMPIALDFIQFMNSNEQLVEYSKTTNTIRPLDYDMTQEDLNSLAPFGRSLFEHKQADNADRVLFMSVADKFVELQIALNSPYSVNYNGTTYDKVAAAMHAGADAETSFEKIYSYIKDLKWSK